MDVCYTFIFDPELNKKTQELEPLYAELDLPIIQIINKEEEPEKSSSIIIIDLF